PGAGTGSSVAQWKHTVTPGTYTVWTTWYSGGARATDAPITVLDGATPVATVRVNESEMPIGLQDSGMVWQQLGVFTFQTNQLVVQLSDAADNSVVADGIRFQNTPGATVSPALAITGTPASGHSPE